MVVQSLDDRQRENGPDRLDGWGLGRVLAQRQVCSDAIVVTRVRAQHMAQMTLAKHDYMIKPLASDRADQSLRMPLSHGDRGAVGLSRMPIARTRRVNASP